VVTGRLRLRGGDGAFVVLRSGLQFEEGRQVPHIAIEVLGVHRQGQEKPQRLLVALGGGSLSQVVHAERVRDADRGVNRVRDRRIRMPALGRGGRCGFELFGPPDENDVLLLRNRPDATRHPITSASVFPATVIPWSRADRTKDGEPFLRTSEGVRTRGDTLTPNRRRT